MSGSDPLDLSGEWTGIYNYPVAVPPVAFEAVLQDSAGQISGSTTELASTSFGRDQRLDAVIDGRREGRDVQFIKMYEQADAEYDVVHYSGAVDPDGDEIAGTWLLHGLSGTFLMIRRPRKTEAAEIETEEKIDG